MKASALGDDLSLVIHITTNIILGASKPLKGCWILQIRRMFHEVSDPVHLTKMGRTPETSVEGR